VDAFIRRCPDPRRNTRVKHRPAPTLAKGGYLGRNLDQTPMRIENDRRSICTPLISYACPRSWGPGVSCECVETKDGLAHLGRIISNPEVSTRKTRPAVATRKKANWCLTSASPKRRFSDQSATRNPDLTRLLARQPRAACAVGKSTGPRSDDMINPARRQMCSPTQSRKPLMGDTPKKKKKTRPHFQIELSKT